MATVALLQNWLTTSLGALTGFYSAMLTAFGGRWPFLVNHPTAHGVAFSLLALGTALSAGISGWYQIRRTRRIEDNASASARFLLQLTQAMGQIVDKKLVKLHSVLPQITSRKAFQKSMHPAEQMENIMACCAEFFRNAFDVDSARKELDITIMARRSDQRHWTWINGGLQRTWNRCDPNELFESGKATLANHCFTSGQECFIPNKLSAAKDGRYTLSTRDRELGPGSAFGFPVSVTCMGVDFDYVVAIVTYGKMLCEETDEQTIQNVETVLREFCRRFEIEVHLRTIKTLLDSK